MISIFSSILEDRDKARENGTLRNSIENLGATCAMIDHLPHLSLADSLTFWFHGFIIKLFLLNVGDDRSKGKSHVCPSTITLLSNQCSNKNVLN